MSPVGANASTHKGEDPTTHSPADSIYASGVELGSAEDTIVEDDTSQPTSKEAEGNS
jgi:hypothetical protein